MYLQALLCAFCATAASGGGVTTHDGRTGPITDGGKKRSQWLLVSAGLLLLVLLLLVGMGTLWDSGPLAPLLLQSTAIVTMVPTRVACLSTRVITAGTEKPDIARYEVAVRCVSAISPQLVANGQASNVVHVPATTARGTLTLYHAACRSIPNATPAPSTRLRG